MLATNECRRLRASTFNQLTAAGYQLTAQRMKKKDQAPQQTLVERQPLTGSRKIYVPGKLHPGIRVAMREIVLADTER